MKASHQVLCPKGEKAQVLETWSPVCFSSGKPITIIYQEFTQSLPKLPTLPQPTLLPWALLEWLCCVPCDPKVSSVAAYTHVGWAHLVLSAPQTQCKMSPVDVELHTDVVLTMSTIHVHTHTKGFTFPFTLLPPFPKHSPCSQIFWQPLQLGIPTRGVITISCTYILCTPYVYNMCYSSNTCGPPEKSNWDTSVLRLLSAKYCEDRYLGGTGKDVTYYVDQCQRVNDRQHMHRDNLWLDDCIVKVLYPITKHCYIHTSLQSLTWRWFKRRWLPWVWWLPLITDGSQLFLAIYWSLQSHVKKEIGRASCRERV